jgi:hypothetical protein
MAEARKHLQKRRLLGGLAVGLGILPAEALYASRSVNQPLFAGKEWVANGAYFNVDIALMSRTGLKIVSACAHNPHGGVIGVDFFLRHLLKRPFLQSFHYSSKIGSRQSPLSRVTWRTLAYNWARKNKTAARCLSLDTGN